MSVAVLFTPEDKRPTDTQVPSGGVTVLVCEYWLVAINANRMFPGVGLLVNVSPTRVLDTLLPVTCTISGKTRVVELEDDFEDDLEDEFEEDFDDDRLDDFEDMEELEDTEDILVLEELDALEKA